MIMGRVKIITSDKGYRKDKSDEYANLNQISRKEFFIQKTQSAYSEI
jgi:hypothetical protein